MGNSKDGELEAVERGDGWTEGWGDGVERNKGTGICGKEGEGWMNKEKGRGVVVLRKPGMSNLIPRGYLPFVPGG